jgi:hypothetical protein
VKQWVPKDLPLLNTIFCVKERIFHISPSSLHGFGLFCMDGIKVGYDKCIELMEYVGLYIDRSPKASGNIVIRIYVGTQ